MPNKTVLMEEAKWAVGRHPGVSGLSCKEHPGAGFTLSFTMQVEQAAEGLANGVLAQEPVQLVFPEAWPFEAPAIRLRADFSRNLAHIYPAKDLEPKWVTPCVVDQPIDTYVTRHGIDGQNGLMARLQEWLDDAAANNLRKNDKYWESMRRDGVPEHIAADTGLLRGLVKYKGSRHTYLTARVEEDARSGSRTVYAVIEKPKKHNAHKISSISKRVKKVGCIPVLFAWGEKPVPDVFPDGVCRLNDLLDAAVDMYGCRPNIRAEVWSIIGAVKERFDSKPIIIIIGVPRPKNMSNAQGQENPHIELIPYMYVFKSEHRKPEGKAKEETVLPAQLRELTKPGLLQALSGVQFPTDKHLQIIGCGSVGSKLALHLGKSGFGNIDPVDRQVLYPHNLSRMGVMIDHRVSWVHKAKAVANELAMLGHHQDGFDEGVGTYTLDAMRRMVRDIVADAASAQKIECAQDTAIIFDATANPNVHDALVNFPIEPVGARVMQGAFYARGNVAMLALEGAEGRRPDLEDLEAHFWRWWMLKTIEGERVWPGDSGEDLHRIQLGEGCGSLTMQMSDMQASLLTAGMAQRVAKHLSEGMGDAGELSIAQISPEDGMSVSWTHLDCEPSVLVVRVDGDWEVRILPDVEADIDAQAKAARADGVETGGYLMGAVNPVLRRITISAHLPAPKEDSKCTASVCVLGIHGAKDALLEMHHASRKAFLALGTWHSHPNGGDASQRDWDTLQDIAKDFHGLPTVSLIWRPEGYKALVRQKLE